MTMFDSISFALLVFVVLLTPGPTNTLLATAGATMGWRNAFLLIPAELSGYALSISTLMLIVGPVARASPAIALGLRFGCALYLSYAAWRLWRLETSSLLAISNSVRFRDVFVTTSLNPKGLLFAFAIFPASSADTLVSFFSYLAAFAVICIGVAFSWVMVGAILGFRAREYASTRTFSRVGAVILTCFAVLLVMSKI